MKNGVKWLFRVFGKNDALAVQNAWQQVFFSSKDDHVRLVLKDLAAYCNFYQSSFSNDIYQTCFNEGSRDVFLHILEMIKMNPEDIVNMENDHNN